MKRDIQAYRWLLAGALCLGSMHVSAAIGIEGDIVTETEFSEPGLVCFPQTSLHARDRKWDSVMLNHYVIVDKQDHFKSGSIFVMFRPKSQPEKVWLYDGFRWENIENTDHPLTYNRVYHPRMTMNASKLQPVLHVTISRNPIDVTPYVNDGEIWVGYGLLKENDTTRESFDEMVSSSRFERVWEIGKGNVPTEDEEDLIPLSDTTICLNMSGMTLIDSRITPQ